MTDVLHFQVFSTRVHMPVEPKSHAWGPSQRHANPGFCKPGVGYTQSPPDPVVVLDNTAPLGVISCGPDGFLYVAVGPSCSNGSCACGVTITSQLSYCSIANMQPYGSGLNSLIYGAMSAPPVD